MTYKVEQASNCMLCIILNHLYTEELINCMLKSYIHEPQLSLPLPKTLVLTIAADFLQDFSGEVSHDTNFMK